MKAFAVMPWMRSESRVVIDGDAAREAAERVAKLARIERLTEPFRWGILLESVP